LILRKKMEQAHMMHWRITCVTETNGYGGGALFSACYVYVYATPTHAFSPLSVQLIWLDSFHNMTIQEREVFCRTNASRFGYRSPILQLWSQIYGVRYMTDNTLGPTFRAAWQMTVDSEFAASTAMMAVYEAWTAAAPEDVQKNIPRENKRSWDCLSWDCRLQQLCELPPAVTWRPQEWRRRGRGALIDKTCGCNAVLNAAPCRCNRRRSRMCFLSCIVLLRRQAFDLGVPEAARCVGTKS
jgi:hypothetical protein